MIELSPTIAAQLAAAVYAVQNENDSRKFLSRSEFSRNKEEKQHLKADVGSRIKSTKDGFGICALGGKNYENDIFLIFRGSTDANKNADWVSNARVGIEFSKTGLPVHLGFNQIFGSMLPTIKDFLNLHPKAGGTIHCIGHSLGGAVATLVADWVSSNRVNTVKLYTFGAPRTGLWRFAKRFTTKLGAENIHRVFHATDPVPMVPIFPFMHAPLPGLGHYVPSNEVIVSAAAHSVGKYVTSVTAANSWLELERSKPLYNVESAIEEWLKSKIPATASSPKVWDWINAALIFVLKKVGVGLFATLEAGLIGLDTIADKVAWILYKGRDLSKDASEWVIHLMRKIMQALGMKIAKTAAELTRTLLRSVLIRLMNRMTEEAQRAIRQIFRG
jgi:triacylglycerol lipase